MTSVNGNSGSQSFPVPYNARTFYLYNNAILLDTTSATSSCATGTTWNGSTCATNTYTVSTSAGSGGSISPTSRSVTYGLSTFFTITPNSGYSINSVSGCNGSLSGSTYTTGAITSACTVSATFTANPVNGVCSATHYNCTAGTSVNNAVNSPNWTWTCNGLYGGTNASCSEAIPAPTNFTSSCPSPGDTASLSWDLPSGYTLSYFRVVDNVTGTNPSVWIPENVSDTGPSTSFATIAGHDYTAWIHTRLSGGGYSSAVYSSFACALPPTGTITPETSSCTILSGASSCNVPLTWSTTNPVGTSAITATGMTPVNGNSGSQNFPVPYSSRTFYLYNNAILLDTASATASCTSGTVWDGSKCATTTGTLTATGCTIPEGSSSCTTNLNWSTSNPIDTSSIRTPNSSGSTIATGNSGSTTYDVPYNTRTFVLVNNGSTINTASPIATCVGGTHWDGEVCISDIPASAFTASPQVIFKGGSSVLTWSSTADSCTSTGPGFNVTSLPNSTSGSMIVSPTEDTTYTLSCTNVTGTSIDSVVTKVIELKIEEN
jgi:hypothetical protein